MFFMKKILTLLTVCCIYTLASQAQTKITADEAYKHMGETVTICDKIYGMEFIDNKKIKSAISVGNQAHSHKLSILLNYDAVQKLTAGGRNSIINKSVCVTGKVVESKGQAEIVINKPEEIYLVKEIGGTVDIKPNDFMKFD